MPRVLVIHGPNLNLIGTREPMLYGHTSLDSLNDSLRILADKHGVLLDAIQSNHEGVLVDYIHLQASTTDYIIMNPAAFTHTSIALRDALLAVDVPFIEVHISNIYARESFRHHSYFSDLAQGVISGLGVQGYVLALQAIIEALTSKRDRYGYSNSRN